MTEKPWDMVERRATCSTCGQRPHMKLQATPHDPDEPVSRLALLGVVVCAMTFWVIAGALVWALLLGGGS